MARAFRKPSPSPSAPSKGQGKGRARPGAVWRNAFAPAGLDFQAEHIRVADQWWRVYAVQAFPPRVREGWLAHAASLPGVTLSLQAQPEPPLELVQALNRRMGAAAGQLVNAHDALSQQRLQRELEDLEALMRQIDAEQQAVVTVGVYLVVQAPDRETGLRRCKRLEGVLGAAGLRARPLLFRQEEGLRAAGPWGEEPRALRGDAPPIWPVSTLAASWFWATGSINHGHGIVLGHDSDGGLVLLDRWQPPADAGITNKNFAILAPPGGGKSHATKLMIVREWAQGAKLVVIDPEREYRGLCERLGGAWLNAVAADTRINPLQAPAFPDVGDADDTPATTTAMLAHVQRVLGFLTTLFPDLTALQRALLQQALEAVYAARGIGATTDPAAIPPEGWPHLGDLAATVAGRAGESPDWQTLAALLRPYAQGLQAGLWAGPSTVPAVQDADFVVLDIHELQDVSEEVRRAQFLNVLAYAWDLVRADRGQRKVLVVDEAWMLIDARSPEALRFMKSLSKRIRKYGGSFMVVTQNVVDFLAPAVAGDGEQVLTNSAFTLLLRQGGKDLDALTGLFTLSDAEQDRLRNARVGEGLLIAGNQRAWVTVDTAPFESRLLYGGT